MIRRVLKQTWLLAIIAVGLLVVAFVIDADSGQIDHVERVGGPIILIGVLSGARSIVRRSVQDITKDKTILGVGGASPVPFDESAREVRKDTIGEIVGLLLALTGTILASYGDIIGVLFLSD